VTRHVEGKSLGGRMDWRSAPPIAGSGGSWYYSLPMAPFRQGMRYVHDVACSSFHTHRI
jgi:hypothetical protein